MTGSASTDELVRLSGSIIQAGSKSFAAAARLFDPETRASAYLLYAWCRHCDDVIDGQELGYGRRLQDDHDPIAELAKLRRQTSDALAGRPTTDPIFVALQKVAHKHAIPAAYPLALLDGFEMDVEARCYETIDDTLHYCYHVAGVVGIMMAIVMGARDQATLDRANDLGLAFQLTNIARDVVDDANNGRIYLPADWLEAEEVTANTHGIEAPANRKRVAAVVRRLMVEAEKYYSSSLAGLPKLDLRSAWAIATARTVYRRIGTEVVRRGPHAWDKRVSTSKVMKLSAVIAGAGVALYSSSVGKFSTPLPRHQLWTRPRV